MGSYCSRKPTVNVNLRDSTTNFDKDRTSADALSEEVVRMLTSQIKNEDDDEEKDYDDNNRLSDLAEMLFLQQQKLDSTPAVEMGNEKPIELESEQVRRRMHMHKASIAGASRFATHRGSIVLSDSGESRGSFSKQDLTQPHPHTSTPLHIASRSPSLEKEAALESFTTRSEPGGHQASEEMGRAASTEQGSMDNETQSASIHFQRLYVSGENGDLLLEELRGVAMSLIHALKTRQFYMRLSKQAFPLKVAKALARATRKPIKCPVYPVFVDPMEKPILPNDEKSWTVTITEGVIGVMDTDAKREVFLPQVNRDRFIANRNVLYALVADGPLKSFCYRRLSFLKNKFGLHCLLNEAVESEIMKSPDRKCRRDFYNVRKVDTHIHAAACMSQKHLLGFMQEKVRREPDRVVLVKKGGKKMTLRQVFESLDLDPFFLNVDALDVHADRQTFQRFDRFNNLYSPMGASELREIFLKSSNDINGDYFAEIIQQVEKALVDQKYHLLELRISIYGKNYKEWADLAKWFISHKLESTHIRWLIQVPRLYDVYKTKGAVKTFQQILDNLFRPLFEATIHPNKHKDIALLLRHVTGFDSVDDESKPEPGFMKKTSPTPDKWDRENNPSYTYYIYYMFANITRLNHLRQIREMNTFVLRPHCGEAGSYDHLLTGFMLAHNISHGLVLKTVPVLQYLYYLAQISLCMSPLSNNHLFLEYNKNPFPEFFARGLKVCLSTDDPLQFHFTMEPLMEEYAVAAQVWKFSVCDMCEMARTSVQASCFSHAEKKRWLGDFYRREGAAGNDICKTNVPNVRVAFREETLLEELRLLCDACGQKSEFSQHVVGDNKVEHISSKHTERHSDGELLKTHFEV